MHIASRSVYLYVLFVSITTRDPGDMWIGLHYNATEGVPVWSDGTTTFTSGIQDSIDKDCVYMNTASEWRYDSCWSSKVVICQGKYNAIQCNTMQSNAIICHTIQ